jgi:(2Fe-2S) ferredoxin
MGNTKMLESEVNLQGEFIGFIGDEPGKYKYLQLAVSTGSILVKIPKELRYTLGSSLTPGEQIRVCGISHSNKIKAYQIEQIGLSQFKDQLPQHQAKIMICQQSGCLKRGGRRLLLELQKTLGDRNLLDLVAIEYTKCQKCCGTAPNYVLQLDNKQYKGLNPEAIADTIVQHLSLS